MKGRVAVFAGARKPLEMREYELPEVEDKAALIKISLANLCGSDLHMWRGDSPFPVGMVAGHEMTGRVMWLGADLSTDAAGRPLQEGDRVVYPYFRFCGTCKPCLRGRGPACVNKLDYWTAPAETQPHFRGAYAEYYYSPPGNPLFKVPDTVSDEMVAPANCALSQVIYGLSKASFRLGDAVIVQGAGGLGIYCTAVAKEMGARMVIVLDQSPSRLDLARDFGADATIDISAFDDSRALALAIRELTDGLGADVVMGLAGVPASVSQGIGMLAPGGCILEIGNIGIGATVSIDPGYMVVRSLSLRTAVCYEPWALGAAVDFLERNREKYPFERILSHKVPFERVNDAIERADRGEFTRASLVFEE